MVTFNNPQNNGDIITVQYVVSINILAVDAVNVVYDNSVSLLTATDVQAAIDELAVLKDYCIATNTLTQSIPDALETIVVSPAYTTNNVGMTATANSILILDA